MPSTLLVPLEEYRQGLVSILKTILSVFGGQNTGESCAGAAIEVRSLTNCAMASECTDAAMSSMFPIAASFVLRCS